MLDKRADPATLAGHRCGYHNENIREDDPAPSMTASTDPSALKTVERAMRVLQAFSHDRPELSVGELSRELGIHKSIVSRLVAALRR